MSSRIAPSLLPDTGVGVLDRCVAILEAIGEGARSHGDVVERTGLSRTTAHRLLKALETHGLVTHRRQDGYRLGPRLARLGAEARSEARLRAAAHPVLELLAGATGESAQLFVASSDGGRVCVDAVQSTSELRTIVPVGAVLPITHGSAGKVFLAWMPAEEQARWVGRVEPQTASTPTGERLRRQLASIRRVGWASSAGERQAGVGSVSAPVLGPSGELLAVVSISGPLSRVGRAAVRRHAAAVVDAARDIRKALAG